MNFLFAVVGGKFKFQVQESFSEYFFLEIWRSGKRIALSEKKATFSKYSKNISRSMNAPLKIISPNCAAVHCSRREKRPSGGA